MAISQGKMCFGDAFVYDSRIGLSFYTVIDYSGFEHERKNKNRSNHKPRNAALEVNAEYFGVSLLQLMENAGRNVALEIASRFSQNKKSPFSAV